MSNFEHATLYAVLVIVAAYHLLHLLDQLLGWPHFLVKIVQKRRQREIAETLATLGISGSMQESLRIAIRAAQFARYNDPKDRCMKFLRSCTTPGNYVVGAVDAKAFSYFVDVMSECLTTDRSDECAYIMTSYLKAEKVSLTDMDFVVGIKGGSPTIAVSLAEKLGKPVALFRGKNQYKYNAAQKKATALFDGKLLTGKIAVIVDDSTTGGRKAFDCIEALRAAGVIVKEFRVMFEPLGKNARQLLQEQQQVTLRAIVTMDEQVIGELTKQSFDQEA